MKFLLKFKLFQLNEELRTIVDNKSVNGESKLVHLIYDDPENAKSFSSSILLRKELSDREFMDYMDILSDQEFNPTKITNPQKLRRLVRIDKNRKKLSMVISNLRFLKDKEKIIGTLSCEYCNKKPLRIYDISFDKKSLTHPKIRFSKFNPIDGATCDHKNPISKGGDPFDTNNLAVACYSCNQKKKDDSWEDWCNYLRDGK